MTTETTTSAADSEQPQIRDTVNDLARMLEAVRYTTGLGAKQMERVEKAKQIAIKAEADRASLLEEVERLRAALEWIHGVATTNYEQDEKLRANGARALKRIADACDTALASTGKGEP